MLTPEQIQAYAKKVGAKVVAPTVVSPLAETLSAAWSQPETPTTGFNEAQKTQYEAAQQAASLAKFVGGEKLAEGVGKAIAKPVVEKIATQQTLERKDRINNLVDVMLKYQQQGNIEQVKKYQDLIRAEINQTTDKGETTLTDFQKTVPTNKEIIGSTIRLAGTAATGNIAGAASKLVGASEAVGIGAGIARGAATGAVTGTTEGAIQGAGMGLEENKDLKGVAKSALIGAGVGGLTGGVVGGVVGGIQGQVNASKIKREKFVQDLVSPKETTAIREQAIREGRVTEAGALKKSEILPSKKEINLAEAAKGVVSPDKSIVENVDAIRNKVNATNEGVKTYIKANKVPFNTNQLRSKLNLAKEESRLIFASDTNAEKTYNAVVDEFMNHVKSKDTSGLFAARQEFDKIPAIKKLLETEGLGENVRKSIVLDVRRAANEYVADLLPKGNQYRADLLKESRLIEVLGNIAEKDAKNIGLNKLQILAREYPWLKWIVGGLAAGAIGGASVGVGGAIIGSTD